MNKFSIVGIIAALVLAVLAFYLIWGKSRPAEEAGRPPKSIEAGVKVFADPEGLVEDKKK